MTAFTEFTLSAAKGSLGMTGFLAEFTLSAAKGSLGMTGVRGVHPERSEGLARDDNLCRASLA
jgi:hypothetical protein